MEIQYLIDYVRPMSIETKFGFRDVEKGEKQGLVNEVFSKVAERYDQMNDLMSVGLHRLWKDDFVAMLNPPRGNTAFSVLDVAGGTGDIAFRIARRGGHGTHVTVADISPEMVAEGRKRAEREGLLARCDFTVGNAEEGVLLSVLPKVNADGTLTLDVVTETREPPTAQPSPTPAAVERAWRAAADMPWP